MVNQGGQSLFSLMVSWFKNITFFVTFVNLPVIYNSVAIFYIWGSV